MRTKLLVLASSVGMLGWGTVLPYQYAYAADTRGWGALAAALASTLFSVGALVAAPFAGRLADRFDPVRVAVVAKLVAALGVASLVWADSPAAFLTGMFVFGLGLTAAVPAQSVLVLRWSPAADRRKVFAYKFTGEAIGMAVGAFVAGQLVDLSRPDGMAFAFAAAGVGFILSGGIIAVAGLVHRAGASDLDASGDPASRAVASTGHDDQTDQTDQDEQPTTTLEALRQILAVPALRWTALITVTLALGFYAQFESGLPAYALTVLDVEESTIGLAAAVNCLVIVALQVVVVRLTAKRSAPALLMGVGAIWTLAWLVLSAAQLSPALASALFVTTFGIFAVGETMYAPVLNPLTAALAPKGLVGTTLGFFTAMQTVFSALGPLVAGVLLGAGLSGAFLGLHLGVSALAVYGAWRLRNALAHKPARRHTSEVGPRERLEPPAQASSSTGVNNSLPASPTERESVAA